MDKRRPSSPNHDTHPAPPSAVPARSLTSHRVHRSSRTDLESKGGAREVRNRGTRERGGAAVGTNAAFAPFFSIHHALGHALSHKVAPDPVDDVRHDGAVDLVHRVALGHGEGARVVSVSPKQNSRRRLRFFSRAVRERAPRGLTELEAGARACAGEARAPENAQAGGPGGAQL